MRLEDAAAEHRFDHQLQYVGIVTIPSLTVQIEMRQRRQVGLGVLTRRLFVAGARSWEVLVYLGILHVGQKSFIRKAGFIHAL